MKTGQRQKMIQNTTQKTEDRATRTPINTGDEFRRSVRVSIFCSMWRPSCYSCYKPGDKSWMR